MHILRLASCPVGWLRVGGPTGKCATFIGGQFRDAWTREGIQKVVRRGCASCEPATRAAEARHNLEGAISSSDDERKCHYHRDMTRFAIDAPTLVQLAEGQYRISSENQLVAPNSIRSRALDILLQRVQSGEISETAALELHEGMTELKMRLLGDRVSRRTAWRIALDNDLDSIEDAEFVAVAKLQADALVTVSPKLASLAANVVTLAKLTDVVDRRGDP